MATFFIGLTRAALGPRLFALGSRPALGAERIAAFATTAAAAAQSLLLRPMRPAWLLLPCRLLWP